MFRNIPIVTKNLLIVNFLAFVAQLIFNSQNPQNSAMVQIGALHFFMASDFHLYQFVTYMFLHASLTHVLFNMFALWMFGIMVENVWGAKKFLFYYIFCGIGAGITQELVQYANYMIEGLSAYQYVNIGGVSITTDAYLNMWYTIGASGAVYAILLAFGMLFPRKVIGVPLAIAGLILLDLVNTNPSIQYILSLVNNIIFIAIIIAVFNPLSPLSQKIWRLLYTKPIEARWCVLAYIVIEILYLWKNVSGDSVAHMAHLGGMLFGYLLIRYWNRHPNTSFNPTGGQDFFDKLKHNFEKRTSGNSGRTTTSGHSGYSSTQGTKEADREYNARKRQNQEEIDAILDKIRKSGYDSLSKEEKQRLFDASRNL